jgi:hypothetical protein
MSSESPPPVPAVVAFSPGYSRPFEPLRSPAMARKTYGPRVIAALIPRWFPTQTALQNATGIAYSSINDWANGKSDPRMDVLEKIADVIERDHGVRPDPVDWLRTQSGQQQAIRPTVGQLPGWTEAEEAARKLRPRYEAWVWKAAREVSGFNCPPEADLALVLKAVDLVRDYPPGGETTEETDAALREVERVKAEAEAALRKQPVLPLPKPEKKPKS